MYVDVRLLHNGATIVGSESRSWQLLSDGELDIPLQPGIWMRLAENDGWMQDVRVRLSIRGVPTVEEVTRQLESVENRLRTIERERFRITEMSLAKDIGLVVPEVVTFDIH